jgi:DNA-binding response OmpR family regulator
MLVDDDPLIRESVADVLELEGYAIAPASTGEAALTALTLGATPSTLILDLWLPGMGSVAFLRTLRARPGGRIPVIILTAWPAVERLDLDADAYLLKPADAAAIVRAVDRLVRGGRRRSPQKARNRRPRAVFGVGQAT